MDVQRIQTEGRRIDPPRNVERLWLAVSTQAVDGATVCGHLVKPGDKSTLIEVYVDQLDRVLRDVRTEQHRQVHATAVQMHETAAAEERRQRKLPPDADLGVSWNGAPELHYAILGYRTGLPPLESCEVVHPQSGERVDARAWQALPETKRREWLVDAPTTPLNAAQRANEHLADVLARALERRDSGGNQGGGKGR